MKRTPISPDLSRFPARFSEFLEGAALYDSSCSRAAKVYYIDKGAGYYLKSAAKGTLEREAAMTRYFHSKALAAEVLAYAQLEQDWLLTARVPGEDCIHHACLEHPERLCDLLGELLRDLHDTDFSGCPVPDRTGEYIDTVCRNYQNNRYDGSLFPDNWGFASPEEAWAVVREYAPHLKADTLLHGDYCLPNIMLDGWRFTGFIDLDNAGVGDRHIDLFWGVWSLQYNLKTDAYRDRFLDAYGRDRFRPEILKAIGAFEVFG